jgi:hypothetical protein
MEYASVIRVLKLKIHISLAKVPQRGIIKYGLGTWNSTHKKPTLRLTCEGKYPKGWVGLQGISTLPGKRVTDQCSG